MDLPRPLATFNASPYKHGLVILCALPIFINAPTGGLPVMTVVSSMEAPLPDSTSTGFGDIDRLEEVTLSPVKKPSMVMVDTDGEGSDVQASGDEPFEPDADTPVRARVFALADDGKWEDIATGIFILESDVVIQLSVFSLI